jgi:hypothetical protein
MSVLLMPAVEPDADRARRQFARACDDVRTLLAAATTSEAAFAIWTHCRALSNELETLTLRAAVRCRELA